MKPMVSLLLSLLLFAAFPMTSHARALSPVEGLELLRRSFQDLQDLTAEVTQEKQLAVMRKKLVMQGIVRFKQPDRFYMELAPPYSSTVLLKDTVLEQRIGVNGERQRLVLPPEQGLARWFGTIARPVTAVPEGMRVRAEQTGSQTSVTINPSRTGQLVELTVVLQDDGTLRRLVLEEQGGNRTVMTFRKVRKNTGLTDAAFRLE